MKSISRLSKGPYMNRGTVFLLVVALIVGMAACNGSGPGPGVTTLISDWAGLDAIRTNLHGNYILMANLNPASDGWDTLVNNGDGWEPIGSFPDLPFRGRFDGNGFIISDLHINRPNEDRVGLFGYVMNGVVTNVTLVDVKVDGRKSVGAVVGENRGTVEYSSSAGSVNGTQFVGGLVGYAWTGTVHNSESWATVFSQSRAAGGLVGYNSIPAEILLSHYRGSLVQGDMEVGGLAGLNNGRVAWSHQSSQACIVTGPGGLVGGAVGLNNGTVEDSSNSGQVVCGSKTGGLVGSNGVTGKVINCGNGGDVNGKCGAATPLGLNCGTVSRTLSADTPLDGFHVGGLVGWNEGVVSNSYSTGSVTGVSYVGGLVGGNEGDVDSCFSTGRVTGDADVGGLVGWNDGTVAYSIWDKDASGMDTGVGGNTGRVDEIAGVSTQEMTDIETYRRAGWDICAVSAGTVNTACTWNIAPGGYPFLSGKESEPAPEPPPPGPDPRTTGPWVDSILITEESVSAAAIAKLLMGELDICAFPITDVDLLATVLDNPNIDYVGSVGSYNELSFNPVPFFNDGRFNPFGFPRIREAVNKLVDRDFIASEIQGGLAMPKYTVLNANFSDATNRYPDLIAAIELKYAYDKAAAEAEIAAEMVALGAELVGGTWHYDGQEIEIIILIGAEDQQLASVGHYLGDQLEEIGFKFTYDYDYHVLWHGDPAAGQFHIYTGGGVTSTVSRDQGGDFGFFYTDMGYPTPLSRAYDTDPDFYETCQKLAVNDFTTLEERRALFSKALTLSLKDSVRIWLTDSYGVSAFSSSVGLAADEAGGIAGSSMWDHTVHFKGADGNPTLGGNLKVAVPSLLSVPLNPIAGSNKVYDMFWGRATGDAGWAIDTRDGLRWPHRFEKAEVIVKTGLPVGVSTALGHDWITLSFAPSINVPGDAWADWDAATQQFIPASTRFPGGTTALRKSVVYYPKDIFEMPLHDGSTLSMGDFIIGAILTFDRAKVESPIYDASAVASLNSFMTAFKGVKFITDDPVWGLIVETYSDFWTMDAELLATHWWPVYAQGPAVWHTLAVAIRAEADKQLAFSSAKAVQLGVEWMSFIAGPSLPILRNQLTLAKGANYIPYAPTMGQYVTADEAAGRYENLAAWSATSGKGHFWVASGPFYLEAASPLTEVVQLTRFEDYPDKLGRFNFMVSP